MMNERKSCTKKSMVVMVLVSMLFCRIHSEKPGILLDKKKRRNFVGVNLENSHLPIERRAEVITNLDHQNSLISSCHDGLSSSIESIASSGHLGMGYIC